MVGSIVEEELSKASIIKDEAKLSLDYVPTRLPHREEELRTLVRLFSSLVKTPGKIAPKVIIRGSIGTGKTALSKRFGEDFEKYVRKRGLNLRFIHVNCREEGSFFNILKGIITNTFEHGFPQRGYSSQELLNILLEVLDRNRAYILIALDELEDLIRKEGADPLFCLTRVQESRPPSAQQRVSLLCIFRDPECEEVYRLLDKSTQSTLGGNVVLLDKYTVDQLRDILEDRVKEAFLEDTVLPESLELIADLAGKHGDARFAIELLWLSGKLADASNTSKLLPEHVRYAQTRTHPTLRVEDLKLLRLHEKLLLLAVARGLRSEGTAYLSFGYVKESYRLVCEEYREKPRAHTQVWKYMKSLQVAGLLSAKISGKGQRGKTTLIGLYAPSEKLEETLYKLLEVKRHG
ncbi:MAG: ORC1-type DNA replication protein [Candidatus Bathyarchaeia archaeon]